MAFGIHTSFGHFLRNRRYDVSSPFYATENDDSSGFIHICVRSTASVFINICIFCDDQLHA